MMIHIDRPVPPAIKIFIENNNVARDGITKVTMVELEREKAIAFFTAPTNYNNDVKLTKENFTFNVYKDSELAKKLEDIFWGKCAYCESHFAHVTPKEIEHFRPKSEINTGTKKIAPGYYWLAGEWDNLLISCPDCNRVRKHTVPGQSKKVSLGKGTQFPLEDEIARVRSHHGNITAEESARLLLNPCLDQPEKHLTFDEDGLVHPRMTRGRPSKKGKTSIDVYALQRKALVEERRRVLNDLRFQFNQLRYLVDLQNTLVANGMSSDAKDRNLAQIQAVTDYIKSLLDKKAPYLGMLREWILKSKQAGNFDDLLDFKIDPMTLI